MSNVDLVSFWYGVLVGMAATGLGTAWPMWRRQSRMNREMVETLATLRSQHLDDRLMRARALIGRWREIARDEEGDPDAAVRAVRKMCAMDLQEALKESER